MSSTISPPVAPPDLRGAQEPSFAWVPPYASTTGEEAVELAASAGIDLDPWQQGILRESLGEKPDGKWAAFEVGVMCPRQNGKNEILIARELAGLYLIGERLIVHSAHEFGTSSEHHLRLAAVIEGVPHLRRRLKSIKFANGKESIELKGGQRLVFKARSKGAGRGFTADLVVLDEAMDISEAAHGVILPTLSARPNPQVWYAGSAVDQWVHDDGVVFARIRERGMRADDESLAYFEWAVDHDNPEAVEHPEDPELWARANPGLGIRVSSEHIAREQRSMDARTFAVERLGAGDWPAADGLANQVIPGDAWNACADVESEPTGSVCFAFDVTPDRQTASIGVAGRREDDLAHVEVVDSGPGTGWVLDRLAELDQRHSPTVIVCDGASPASALLGEVTSGTVDVESPSGHRFEVRVVNTREYAQACGIFYDHCEQVALRHLDTSELTTAVRGVTQRPLGDAWAWSRKSSSVNISPLVACTLALWGLATQDASVYAERGLIAI
ncbi:MAG: terminase [Actinomycetota bacterium]|nr:terminase [Actinomycetota bacterium]